MLSPKCMNICFLILYFFIAAVFNIIKACAEVREQIQNTVSLSLLFMNDYNRKKYIVVDAHD